MADTTQPRVPIPLELYVGNCDGYGCECGEFVKGPPVHGWPTCAREGCRHTQHMHRPRDQVSDVARE